MMALECKKQYTYYESFEIWGGFDNHGNSR